MSEASTSHFTERFSDKISFDMIHVEGGCFMMGDWLEDAHEEGKSVHEVKLSGFYIARFPVTQRLWIEIMGSNPAYFNGLDRPVENVSWEDCQEFLSKLNTQTGKSYRLPTEAEWEYAARGGLKNRGFTYAGSNKLKEVAWYSANSHEETKAVGQKLLNELGIYDMSGNVDEWCGDWYSGSFYQECADNSLVENPKGLDSGSIRVYRGGSWDDSPQGCRMAYRSGWRPGSRDGDIGFRLAMSLQ